MIKTIKAQIIVLDEKNLIYGCNMKNLKWSLIVGSNTSLKEKTKDLSFQC